MFYQLLRYDLSFVLSINYYTKYPKPVIRQLSII